MRRILLRTLLVLVVVVAVLVGVLLHWRHALARQGFRWEALAEAMRQMQFGFVLAAVVLIYVCYAVRALRWMVFSRSLGSTRFPAVYAATIMGFAGVFVLGRAGEPIRPLLVARKDRMPLAGMFGVYVLERVFDIASTIALFAIGLVIATHEVGGVGSDVLEAARGTGLALLAVEIVLVGLLIYFRLHGAQRLERRLLLWQAAGGWRERIARACLGFSQGLQAIRSARDLLEAVGYSVVHWVLVAVALDWVLKAFGPEFSDLTFADAILVLGVTMLGAMVQLPAVGGGAQAATFFVLSGLFGYDPEPSAAAAIVLWLVTFASACVVGLPLLIHEGISMGELWRMVSRSVAREQASPPLPTEPTRSPTGRLAP